MRLKEVYKKEVVPKLREKFGYKNEAQVPKIVKVVLNVGFGAHSKEKEYIDGITDNLARITGQVPILTKAKKSISSFKIRKGMIIGAAVTLRGQRMYDFLDRLINITFPRVRDFRGLSDKGVDRTGNLAIGFKEHLAFPEIKAEEIDKVHGLEICAASTAKSREEGLELFTLLGFPFKKEN